MKLITAGKVSIKKMEKFRLETPKKTPYDMNPYNFSPSPMQPLSTESFYPNEFTSPKQYIEESKHSYRFGTSMK